MGNRAVITTKEKQIGLYLQWNGGRDSVEPFLAYCKAQGYRPPSQDCYGWARLAQVVGNYFGGTLSVGLDRFKRLGDQGDNGVYVIDGWEIVDRLEEVRDDDFNVVGWREFPERLEQREYDFDEMLADIDASMPPSERLGDYLFAEEVPTISLKKGDQVWYDRLAAGKPEVKTVQGFGDSRRACTNGVGWWVGVPYVDVFENGGVYWKNPNNYLDQPTCKLYRRAGDPEKAHGPLEEAVLDAHDVQ